MSDKKLGNYKNFKAKIYFFMDEFIDINEITLNLNTICNIKAKIYINETKNNICYSIYLFNSLSNSEFQNISLVLENIIKKFNENQIVLFYKNMLSSKSYDYKYYIKGIINNTNIEICKKFTFINDDD